jgi:hypothetical protein
MATKREDGLGRRLIAATLWHRVGKRAGEVLDSRCGSVGWVADSDDQAFDVVNADLPVTRVTFRLEAVTARIGSTTVEIEVGSQGIRRSTHGAQAEVGGRRYRLMQRGRRLAELERDGETVALLARPRRGSRSVNWAMAQVTGDEIAVGHCLAVCADIGSPGAVANLSAVLPI